MLNTKEDTSMMLILYIRKQIQRGSVMNSKSLSKAAPEPWFEHTKSGFWVSASYSHTKKQESGRQRQKEIKSDMSSEKCHMWLAQLGMPAIL